MLRFYVPWKCPYCETDQCVYVEVEHPVTPTRVLVRCDTEEHPGCDKLAVLEVTPRIEVEVYKLTK